MSGEGPKTSPTVLPTSPIIPSMPSTATPGETEAKTSETRASSSIANALVVAFSHSGRVSAAFLKKKYSAAFGALPKENQFFQIFDTRTNSILDLGALGEPEGLLRGRKIVIGGEANFTSPGGQYKAPLDALFNSKSSYCNVFLPDDTSETGPLPLLQYLVKHAQNVEMVLYSGASEWREYASALCINSTFHGIPLDNIVFFNKMNGSGLVALKHLDNPSEPIPGKDYTFCPLSWLARPAAIEDVTFFTSSAPTSVASSFHGSPLASTTLAPAADTPAVLVGGSSGGGSAPFSPITAPPHLDTRMATGKDLSAYFEPSSGALTPSSLRAPPSKDSPTARAREFLRKETMEDMPSVTVVAPAPDPRLMASTTLRDCLPLIGTETPTENTDGTLKSSSSSADTP